MQSLSKVSMQGILMQNTMNLTSSMFLADQSELIVNQLYLGQTQSQEPIFEILSDSILNVTNMTI